MGRDDMTYEEMLGELFRDAAEPTPDEIDIAQTNLARAVQRWSTDPEERRRIRDLGDLLDAETTLYEQATAALDRGDLDTAETLLRQCADMQLGDAQELLDELLARREADNDSGTEPPGGDVGDTPAAPPVAAEDASSPRHTLFLAPHHGTALVDPAVDPIFLGLGTAAMLRNRRRLLVFTESSADRDHFQNLTRLLKTYHAEFVITGGNQGADCHLDWRLMPDVAVVGVDRDLVAFQAKYFRFCGDPDQLAGRCVRNLVTHALDCVSPGLGGVARLVGEMFSTCVDHGLSGPRRFPLWDPAERVTPPSAPRTAADVLVPYSIPELSPDDPIEDALERMLAGHDQALPVRDSGWVAGIVILTDAVASGRSGTAREPVSSIMRKTRYAKTDTPIDTIRDLLIADSTGLLPVLDADGSLAGYVSPLTALAAHTDTGDGTAPSSQKRSSGLITSLYP
jgi:CBS domain-containing protein